MKKLIFLFLGLFLQSFLIADYSYDENGNIASIYIPENGEVLYKYDPIQRLIEARYPNRKHFSYTYDYNSNLRSVETPDGTTKYTYDKLNRIETVHFTDGSSLAYQYDLMGRVTHLAYPDGEIVEYHYDSRGRLKTLQDHIGVTSYDYDDLTNLVSKESLPNGTTTEYLYDATPQILEVFQRDPWGGLIGHFSYEYNKVGQIIRCIEKTSSSTTIKCHTYDDLGRLLRSEDERGNFEEYTYDGAGNRLTKSTQDGTINYRYDNKNRLIQAGNTTYHYDSVGNLTQKTSPEKTVEYSYDPIGKLISYSDGKTHVEFGYDGEGRRISKTVNGETTFFINDPQSKISRVLIEKDNEGQLKKKYIYGLSRVIQRERSGIHYFLYDQPGKSVCSLLDHHTLDQSSMQYDSFGNLSSPVSETSYLYNGEEYDEETGLIFLRNRYYDPEIGRFISPDFILGNLKDPQSLNPYVFVRNNPLSFVDPLGLYGVKVPLTFYGNYPGSRIPEGKSRVGHGWIGGVDANGIYFSQGAWPRGVIEKDESMISLCHETVHMTVWVTPEQSLAARIASGEPKYSLCRNNCIDHVVKALDAIEYPHPIFKDDPHGISLPTIYCNWIKQESNHIHPNFLPQPGDILIDYTMPVPSNQSIEASGKFSFSYFTPNYGGVLLDKSAEIFTELRDISGVLYDEQTGQMIFYGQKNLSLPYMDTDDLAVTVRSIYGLGSKAPESPGVSMEPGYKNPKKKTGGCMVVSYFGETENTRFGQVMFESDRVLKILSIGKDNITGKSIKSSVPGYRSLQEIQAKEGFPNSNTYCRLWFVPQRITLSESFDGTSMVFNEARMEVLTESTLRKKGVVEDRAAEKFAQHFTNYYDHFSQEYPILSELKRLGKITAIVKWIYEKNLPFDLSFFKGYTPAYYETPKYSPAIANMAVGQLILGGVVYTLTEENYHVQKSEQAEALKEEILSERPSDESVSWNFGRGLIAVAKQVGKAIKVGEVNKTFVDLAYPNQSKIPLAFVRIYNSFNDDRIPFGRGWNSTLAKLSFNRSPRPLEFSDGLKLSAYPEITIRLEGNDAIYHLAGLNGEKRPVYKKEGTSFYVVHDLSGNFHWIRKDERLIFDSRGAIVRIEDLQGLGVSYEYENGYLARIVDDGGKAIEFVYVEDQIFSAQGPGGKIIYYEYDPNGLLQTVRDDEGILTTYEYDEGERLSAIYNGRGNNVFEAKYDKHHRAIEQIIGENLISYQFNLHDRTALFEGSNNYSYQEQFDSKYRPELIQDILGREIQLTYGQDDGPKKLISNAGLEVDYEYDDQGNLSTIYDDFHGERRFTYNHQGQVIHEKDGEGVETVYQYDDKGHLIEMYYPFFISSIGVSNGKSYVCGNISYLTSFDYDQTTGLLNTITFPGGQKQSYRYDDRGLPIEIRLSDGMIVTKEYDERACLKNLETRGKKISYSYDQRDRIKKISSQDKETHFSYDAAGNLSRLTDPLNRTVYHDYDHLERLIQTIDPEKGMTSYEYTSSGLSRVNLPNGSTREIFYDDYGRPVAIR
ncbi:MAG: RHS repeat-associated core domain-containing protein [Simkaniaceae bacterium]